MKIDELSWYLESDSLRRPVTLAEIENLNEEGGVLLSGALMSLEIDRRLIKYDPMTIAPNNSDYMYNIFSPSEQTLSFESPTKSVYLYKAPMQSDVANMKPFAKRGIIGKCYQLGSVGHQICVGPTWTRSSGIEVKTAPKGVFFLFYKSPNLTAQAATLANAVVQAVRSNGPLKVTEKTFNERKSICQSCEYYDPSAFMNSGRCRVCGCGVAKLYMPNQECPKGKWGKERPS